MNDEKDISSNSNNVHFSDIMNIFNPSILTYISSVSPYTLYFALGINDWNIIIELINRVEYFRQVIHFAKYLFKDKPPWMSIESLLYGHRTDTFSLEIIYKWLGIYDIASFFI